MKITLVFVFFLVSQICGFAQSALRSTPVKADLVAYVPPVIDQGNRPADVAWATAYYAYTTQYAAQQNITDTTQLKKMALSPLLPYLQLRPTCERGLDLDEIAAYIVQHGDVLYTEFPATSCSEKPTPDLMAKANANRPIKTVLRLFDGNANNHEKVFRAQEQVAKYKAPVIVGIKTTDAFMRLTATDDYYRPTGNYRGLHAVTVVGYDATSFLLVNSWGSAWGKRGFFRMRFSDFATNSVGAISLVLPGSEATSSK